MIFVAASPMRPCSSDDENTHASLPRSTRKLAGGKASTASDTPGSSVQKIMHPGGVSETSGDFVSRPSGSQKLRILRRWKADHFRTDQIACADARRALVRQAHENPVSARTDSHCVGIRHQDRLATLAANPKRHEWPGISQLSQSFDFHAAHERPARPSVQVPAPLRGADRLSADPGVLPPANFRQASGLKARKIETPVQEIFRQTIF